MWSSFLHKSLELQNKKPKRIIEVSLILLQIDLKDLDISLGHDIYCWSFSWAENKMNSGLNA